MTRETGNISTEEMQTLVTTHNGFSEIKEGRLYVGFHTEADLIAFTAEVEEIKAASSSAVATASIDVG